MNGTFTLDNSALGILVTLAHVLFDHARALDNHTLLFRHYADHTAPLAFVGASNDYDLVRIKFFVDDDDGIAIKSEIGTIIPSDRFARTDDDCIYHFAFFDRSVWRRFFDVGFDNITDVGVALIAAQYTDRCRALGAGVIGDIQNRANL